jgi:LCP family protein required for cell wall assembly
VNRWIRLLEWLVVATLLVLIVIGANGWRLDAGVVTVVVTPTPAAEPLVLASPTPEPTLAPAPTATGLPPTWTATPIPPTRTPRPSPTATPTPTLEGEAIVLPVVATPVLQTTAVMSPALPQPSPMPIVGQPKGTINILLLGNDRRPGEQVARTDVLLIVSIYPDVPAVSMISIPRDFYAWIPTWGLDKINTAYLRASKTNYPDGGPALVKATIEYNFGIPIHYYAMVDFDSYQQIVDAVGGVDIVVECPFHDTYPDPDSETGQTDIDLEPGVYHLNGKYALWYVRSRWNTSDYDRHRRQQQVLRAIYHQAISQNMLLRVPELWEVYQSAVTTDMGLKEMLYFATIAARLDERDIKARFIRGSDLLQSWTAPNGGAVLVPQPEAMAVFMAEAAQPPVTSRAAQRAYRVEVINGSGNAGWGHVAAYRLGMEGFEVVSVTDTNPQPGMTIIDYTTTSKGSPLWKLLALYKMNANAVTSQPTEGSPVDFRVLLGYGYDPCRGTITAYWHATLTPTPTPTPAP